MDLSLDSYFLDAIRLKNLQSSFPRDSLLETPQKLQDSEDELMFNYWSSASISDGTPQADLADLLPRVDGTKHEPQGRSGAKVSRSRKTLRFTKTQRTILKTWINAHSTNLYPDHTEEIDLMEKTGLTRRQVRNWFVRRRQHLFRTVYRNIDEVTDARVAGDSDDSYRHAILSSLQVSPPRSEKPLSDAERSSPPPRGGSLASRENQDPCALSFGQYGGSLIEFYLETIADEMGVDKPYLDENFESVQDIEARNQSGNPKQDHTFKHIEYPASVPSPSPPKVIHICGGNSVCSLCENNRNLDKVERIWKCSIRGCEDVPGFIYRGQLFQHQREVHMKILNQAKEFFCPHQNCYYSRSCAAFECREDLEWHERLWHSGDAASAAGSYSSGGSSVASWRGRRQGRALFESEPSASSRISLAMRGNGAHPCEECGKSFTRPFSLKRHQNTVHAGTGNWICEGTVQYDAYGEQFNACPRCGRDVYDPRQCPHRMPECWKRDIELRTFDRRDCLVQHWEGKSHTLRTDELVSLTAPSHDPFDFGLIFDPSTLIATRTIDSNVVEELARRPWITG